MVTHTPDNAEAAAPLIAVARAERSADGKCWILTVDRCPGCGRTHAHGGGTGAEPSYGDRSAHCIGPNRCGGYELVPAGGAA